MVMQPTEDFFVGGSNTGRVNTPPPPPPPPPTVSRPGFEAPTNEFASAVLPFDWWMLGSNKLPHYWRCEPRSGEYAAGNNQPTRVRTAAQKVCISCVTIRPVVV